MNSVRAHDVVGHRPTAVEASWGEGIRLDVVFPQATSSSFPDPFRDCLVFLKLIREPKTFGTVRKCGVCAAQKRVTKAK